MRIMGSLIEETVYNDLISDKIARKVARGEKLTPLEYVWFVTIK